jgi:HK97 family phage portal protein
MVNATLERCIAMLAGNQAALDLEVIDLATQEEMPLHPVAMLWNRKPNNFLSARMTRELFLRRMQRYGQCFAVVDRGANADGIPKQIMPIFDSVRVVVDNVTDPLAPVIQGFQVGTRRIALLPQEVLWLRFPNGETMWDYAAPAAIASYPVKVDAYAREWQLGELRNGGRPSGILKLGDVPEDTKRGIMAQFKSTVMGASNAAKVVTLSGDMATGAGFERISLTPEEMSYVESRGINAREVALAMGVPGDLLFGQSTFDNQRSAKVALWTETIVPQLDVIASEIDRQLIDDPTHTCRFDVDGVDALREQLTDQYNRVQKVTISDITTIDESREAIGLEPLPNGLGKLTLTPYRAMFGVTPAVPGGTTNPPMKPDPSMMDEPDPDTEEGAEPLDIQEDEGERASNFAIREGAKTIRVHTDIVQRHHRLAAARMQGFFGRQGTAVRDHYEESGSLGDALEASHWAEQIRKLTITTLEAASADAENSINQQIGAAQKGRVRTHPQSESIIAAYIRKRAQFTAESMDSTTREEVTALVHRMIEDGADAAAITSAIGDYFGPDGRGGQRAEMFAVTETYPMVNLAARNAVSMSDAAEARRWITAQDDRVDDDCQPLEGQTTGVDEPYPSGEEPGDVHFGCRCAEEFVLRDLQPSDLESNAKRAIHRKSIELALMRLADKMERVLERRRAKDKAPLVDFEFWMGQTRAALAAPMADAELSLGELGLDLEIVAAAWCHGSMDIDGDYSVLSRNAAKLSAWIVGSEDEEDN